MVRIIFVSAHWLIDLYLLNNFIVNVRTLIVHWFMSSIDSWSFSSGCGLPLWWWRRGGTVLAAWGCWPPLTPPSRSLPPCCSRGGERSAPRAWGWRRSWTPCPGRWALGGAGGQEGWHDICTWTLTGYLLQMLHKRSPGSPTRSTRPSAQSCWPRESWNSPEW